MPSCIRALQLVVVLLFANAVFADERDTSKPTNFYTRLESNLEYTEQSDSNVFGYRGNLQLAPNPENLVLAEVPLLYNDKSKKFGLGDLRARWFHILWRDYAKKPGVWAPSVDVIFPTGSFEDGLGSSSWIVAPGLATGFVFDRWSTFPIVSYQYISKPITDKIPEAQKKERHGITLQAITSINFTPDAFLWLTPIYDIRDLDDSSLSGWRVDVNFQMSLTEDIQGGAFVRYDFETELGSYRVSVTNFI